MNERQPTPTLGAIPVVVGFLLISEQLLQQERRKRWGKVNEGHRKTWILRVVREGAHLPISHK
jgi:hypothetical protein